MAAHDLLNLLHGVKKTGPNRWIARCSAHEDKRPSLTITEKDDGKVLIHCWAGCGAADILGAIGLEFDALYPPKDNDHRGKPIKRAWNPYDVLKCLESDAFIAWLISNEFAKTGTISEVDKDRLWKAAMNLNGCLEKIRG